MPIYLNDRQEPKQTLQRMDVHASWSRHYRTSENDRFFDLAFGYICGVFGSPADGPVVDAGCGSGTKSLQLARRGYNVLALDFSALIVESARTAAADAALGGSIEFMQGDLTALSLGTGSARRILCWGVLMHIPDVERAVAELARVLAPGGLLIISEGNFRSVQARTLRLLKRLLGRERADMIETPAGIEFWEETGSGRLMTRQADIPWLIAEFEKHGLELERRRAGQFSEIYTNLKWRLLRRMVHAFNNAWFRSVRAGGPSFGNLLVLRRRA